MDLRATVVGTALVSVAIACSKPGPSATPGPGRGPPDRSGPVTAHVTKVTDGDTIHVELNGKDERVRLIGVNTPEVGWYGGQGECYGAKAGLYTRRRLTGATVRLAFDVARRDPYGRLLAYIYVSSELFNATLVQAGYARADPVPPDTRLASAFQRAQQEAEARRIGLWSACAS